MLQHAAPEKAELLKVILHGGDGSGAEMGITDLRVPSLALSAVMLHLIEVFFTFFFSVSVPFLLSCCLSLKYSLRFFR